MKLNERHIRKMKLLSVFMSIALTISLLPVSMLSMEPETAEADSIAPHTTINESQSADTVDGGELISVTSTITASYVSTTGAIDPQSSFALLDSKGNQLQIVEPADGLISFSPIELAPAEVGSTHIYQIKGLGGDNPDIDYDTRTIRMFLSIEQDESGKVIVKQEASPAAVFVDKYPDGLLTVEKDTTDGDYKTEFEFTATFEYPEDESDGEERKSFCAWYHGENPLDYALGHIAIEGTTTDDYFLDGYIVFGVGEPDKEYNDTELTEVWYGIENMEINSMEDVPWQMPIGGSRYNKSEAKYGEGDSVTIIPDSSLTKLGTAAHIVFRDEIFPNDISYWFADSTAVIENIENLNLAYTVEASHAFDAMTLLDQISYENAGYYGIIGPVTSNDISQLFKLDFSNIEDISYMFANMTWLASINVPSNTYTSASNAEGLFSGCIAIKDISFGNDVFTSCNISNMFADCKKLERIMSQSWSNVRGERVFSGCSALIGGNGTKYNSDKIDSDMAVIDNETHNGYFSDENTVERVAYYADNETGEVIGVFGTGTPQSTYEGISLSEIRYGLQYNNTDYVRKDITQAIFEQDVHPVCLSFAGTSLRNIELNGHLKLDNQKSLSSFLYNTKCVDVDLSSLDVSEVTDMFQLFAYSYKLETVNLSGWDTRKVTRCSSIFRRCASLSNLTISENFDLNLRTSDDFTDVESNSHKKSTPLFAFGWINKDISDEMISSASLRDIIATSNADKQGTWEIVSGNTPESWGAVYNKNDLYIAIIGGENNEIPVSYEGMDLIACQNLADTSMSSGYGREPVWTEFPVSEITVIDNVKAPKTMSNWFGGRYNKNLNKIKNLNLFDTSSTTEMDQLFSNLKIPDEKLDLSSWDVSNVNFNCFWGMFESSAFEELNLTGWNLEGSTVTDLFAYSKINNLVLSKWVLPSVTNIGGSWEFFRNASIDSLSVDGWDFGTTVRQVTMSSFGIEDKILDISTWNVDNITFYARNYLFDDVSSFVLPHGFTATASTSLIDPGHYSYKNWHHTSLDGEDLGNYSYTYVRSMGASGDDISGTWTCVPDDANNPNPEQPLVPDLSQYSADAVIGCLYGDILVMQNNSTYINETFREKRLTKVFPNICDDEQTYQSNRWHENTIRTVVIAEKIRPKNVTYMFSMSALTNIENIELIDLSNTTSLNFMFAYAYALTNLNLNAWDVAHITDFRCLFANDSKLEELHIEQWNTASAVQMNEMFYSCRALEDIRLDNFNTSNVVYFCYMFEHCENLRTIDLSMFDTSSAEQTHNMFYGCSSLTELDLSNFDTSNIFYMKAMFAECSSLSEIKLSNFDTSQVINMSQMFENDSQLIELDLSNFNMGNVEDMSSMFYGCNSLSQLDVSTWDTSSVKNMSSIFNTCSSLTAVNVSSWDTSAVEDMSSMFYACSSLITIDISHWDISAVSTIRSMFHQCTSLSSLDISSWNTSNITNMGYVFAECWKLEEINIQNWETENVTNMECMFYNCMNIESLDLSNISTTSLVTFRKMFANCYYLKTIYVSDTWDTSWLTNYYYRDNVFYHCISLEGGEGTEYDSNNTSGLYARIDTAMAPGYFTNVSTNIPINNILNIQSASAFATSGSTYFNGDMVIRYHSNMSDFVPKYSSYDPVLHGQYMSKDCMEHVVFVPEPFKNPEKDGLKVSFWTTTPSLDDENCKVFFNGDVIAIRDMLFDQENSIPYIDLYAHWVESTIDVDNRTSIDFTLRGGEKTTFTNIPSGTSYTVTEKSTGKWTLKQSSGTSGVVYAGEEAHAFFINEPDVGDTLIEIPIVKKLDGIPASDFEFELWEDDKLLDTVISDENGAASFWQRYSSPGKYSYIIKEKQGALKNIVYDNTEYEITVEVTFNGSDFLAQMKYPDNIKVLSFDNETKSNRHAQIHVSKLAEGFELFSEQFMFKMVDDDGKTIATTRNTATGEVIFDLTFPNTGESFEGVYSIVEDTIEGSGSVSGDIIYDESTYKVKISFAEDSEQADITFYDSDDKILEESPVFVNRVQVELPWAGMEGIISLIVLGLLITALGITTLVKRNDSRIKK